MNGSGRLVEARPEEEVLWVRIRGGADAEEMFLPFEDEPRGLYAIDRLDGLCDLLDLFRLHGGIDQFLDTVPGQISADFCHHQANTDGDADGGVGLEALIEANEIENPRYLQIGQRLLIRSGELPDGLSRSLCSPPVRPVNIFAQNR